MNKAPTPQPGQERATTRVLHTDYRSPAPVALCFGDGPDPIWTLLVSEALASVGARATFFVAAPRAARYPSLISRMRERGHDVAFHCVEHVRHDAMTRREIEADVESGLLALGQSVRYWRTPWGLITPATEEVANTGSGSSAGPPMQRTGGERRRW